MHTNTTKAALLAACFLAVAAMPVNADSLINAEAPASGSCTKSEDDGGFGGTTVECDNKLPCGAGAELVIAAVSGDTKWGEPTVAGSYNCGGQGAPCPAAKQACAGLSPGLTRTTGQGDCEAESDEMWSSMLTVACAVVGGFSDQSPMEVICSIYPDFPDCPEDGGMGVNPWPRPPVPPVPPLPLDAIRQLCQEAAEAVGVYLEEDVYDLLIPWQSDVNPPQVTAMSSTVYFPDHTAVSFLYIWGLGSGVCVTTVDDQ